LGEESSTGILMSWGNLISVLSTAIFHFCIQAGDNSTSFWSPIFLCFLVYAILLNIVAFFFKSEKRRFDIDAANANAASSPTAETHMMAEDNS
jgi:hypothetical protein